MARFGDIINAVVLTVCYSWPLFRAIFFAS
jgi:hypothetical protein